MKTNINDLLSELFFEFSDFKIKSKNNQVPYWLKPIFKLASIFNKQFYTDYVTVVGNVIYVPGDVNTWLESTNASWILRHERVHMRDNKKFKFFFLFSYIFLPLPIFFTFRAYWELRGYTQSMIAYYEKYNNIPTSYIESLVEIFTGPGYLYMWKNEAYIRKKLMQIRGRILTNQISGSHYPHKPQ